MRFGATVCQDPVEPGKTEIIHETAANLAAYLNGQPRAIERSSGGLTIGTAIRVVSVPTAEGKPEVRLRIKFRDFCRNSKGLVDSARYQDQYKSLLPQEIRPFSGLSLQGENLQRFLLDFGNGAIPVHVIAFDWKNPTLHQGTAYFIELGDFDNVRNGSRSAQIWVRVYAVDALVLRFLPEDYRRSANEFQKALANYSRLLKQGKRLVPGCFELSPPFKVPGGLGISELRTYLSVLIKQHQRKNQSTEEKENTFEISEDGLIPFGTFE